MKNKIKNKKSKSDDADSAVGPSCKMRLVEDPRTGEIEMVYSKGCRKKYIESIAGRIATRGIRFRSEIDEEDK